MQLKLPTSKWKKFLLFIGINFLLFILILFFLFSYPKLYKINNIEISSIKNNKINCAISAQWKNDNYFSILINKIHFKGSYKNNIFFEDKSDKSFKLLARNNSNIKIECQLELSKISELWNDFTSNDSIPVLVKYNGNFTRFGISQSGEMEMYFQSKEMLDMILSDYFSEKGIEFKNLKIDKIGLLNWIWSFDLSIFNKFPSKIDIEKIAIKIYPDDKSKLAIGNYYIDESTQLKAKTKHLISGKVQITLAGLLNGILNKTVSQELTFYMKGNILLKLDGNTFNIPISKKIKFDPISQNIEIII